MRLAIATDGKNVSEHFGHCEGFQLYQIEDGKIIQSKFVKNPGHKKGFLPAFLADIGVSAIISGGMGKGAIDIFNERGIDIFTGAQGENDDIAKSFADGTLVSTGSICHQHLHKDSCGEH